MKHQYGMSTANNQEYQMPYANHMEIPYEQRQYGMDDYDHNMNMYDFCHKHRYHYVMVEMDDGNMYDGIIHKVDRDQVDLLMPVGDQREENEEERQYGFVGYYGYPYGGYWYPYGGYGIPLRFRRFRRFRFPFFRIRRFRFPHFY
jgi:hypothetical protein